MPELPEVESTVRRLRRQLPGSVIQSLTVGWKNMAPQMNLKKVQGEILGAQIDKVRRRGKYIVLEISNSESTAYLILHQKMSGRLKVFSSDEERSPYDHVVLQLAGKMELRLTDPRKFGRIYFCYHLEEVLGALGPEPLSATFTVKKLEEIISSRTGGLKSLLLNQNIIAGLGNIYVDEVLWRSALHPLRKAHTLTRMNIAALHTNIQKVLREAIKAHGTDFGDGVIYGGAYSPAVYGRAGEACRNCKSLILRSVVAGRGTHFCQRCQS